MTDSADFPPAATAPPPRGLDQLWDAMRRTGVRRPTDDRWVGGVCAGTARRLGVDPVLLRVAVAATVLLGGIGVIAYALALVLLPDHDARVELERAGYGDLTGTTVGAVALLLLAVVAPSPWALLGGGDLVTGGELVGALVVGTLLLVGLALLPQLRQAMERSSGAPSVAHPPTGPVAAGDRYGDPGSSGRAWTAYGPPAYGPPPPRPPRPVRAGRRGPGPAVSAAATGLALVAAGSAWLVTWAGLLPGRPAVVAACAALVVLGGLLVGLGIAGRRDGGVGFTTALVLLAVVGLLLVPSWRTTQLVGDRTWMPGGVAEAVRGGAIGLGDGTLDLSRLADLAPGAAVAVPVRVGIGELTVLVPEGMDVRVDAGAIVGSTFVDDGSGTAELDGVGIERRLVASADPQVVVDARALIGTVRVVPVDAP